MGKKLFYFIIFLFGLFHFCDAQNPQPSSQDISKKIRADVIVVKLKKAGSANARTSGSSEDQLKKLKDLVSYTNHHQVFAQKSFSSARIGNSNLQNIYKLKLESGANIWKELAKLRQLDFIEYAEPFFQNELLFIPNDPQANPNDGLQDYLTVIKAYEGWQIERSDSSMVIGIVDTGVNMSHEDLGNVAFNHADSINGIDDDGDGYIDNFNGWDISDDDNDPTADGHPHGTPVAGMSSAKTNNGIGMAGIGFNSTYLPVKIAETSSQILTNEYEGIVYAADHGCKVINLSWGGPGNYTKYGQDIINYAVLEKDVVVVAAAGNTHDELDFYPASYDNVLSVGATDVDDNLASWATYSYYIDVMAPGDNVYSAKNNGGYEKTTGSSFASPLVAGAAALVRAHFPELSAVQVMEQLRVTSDDIYQIGSNMDLNGQLGKGRLNVHKALSDIITPAIRLSDFNFESNHNKLIFPGDTVSVNLEFTNYLRNAQNVTFTISNPSSNVSFEIDPMHIDKLGELEVYENSIQFIVNPTVQPRERLLFRIDFEGDNYVDFQYFEIQATPEYFDFSDGNISATVTSDGDIGYNDVSQTEGNGIWYKEDFIATNTGLIISLDSNHVMDNVINNFSSFSRDEDFIAETTARLYDNSVAAYDARSVFKPQDTVASALDIKVEQKVLAWENTSDDGYLVYEYRIINTGDSALSGINAGIFADWDLGDFEANEAAWDDVDNFGFVVDKSSNELFAGIALLTEQDHGYYSIDIGDQNGNTADLDSIFNDIQKHGFLTSSTPKSQAGMLGAGNDVAQVIGGKGMNLEPSQSSIISFVMLASNSLDGLKSALDKARSDYATYQNNPPVSEVFYACTGDSAIVDPEGEVYEFYADVETTQRLDSGLIFKTKPIYTEQEYYAINLDSGYTSQVMKLRVLPGNPVSAFLLSTDTLLIEAGGSEPLRIENTTKLGDEWLWNFGNGYSSNIQHPTINYDLPGNYKIELIASNTYGCSDTTSENFFVAVRSVCAQIEDQQICKGTKTSIKATNTDYIRVYKEKQLLEVLYEGAEFLTDEITSDTLFYVVNADGLFESIASEVSIKATSPEMGFEYHLDTLNLQEKYVLHVYNSQGDTDSLSWLVDGFPFSNEQEFDYVYNTSPFEITQIKVDEEFCSDSLTLIISPTFSNLPSLHNIEICKNSDMHIAPENGNLFYFYEDESLQKLIHKGTSLIVANVDVPTKYYVSGIDGLLESASTSVSVSINPVKAIIRASADTIDLQKEHEVELLNQSQNAQKSYWLLPTGTYDTALVQWEFYEYPGAYSYTLVAEGTGGCYDTASYSVQVVNITGLMPEKMKELDVYPNPVTDLLNIDLGDKLDRDLEMELLDISGKQLNLFHVNKGVQTHQISLGSLKRGVYFLRATNARNQIIIKILKE